MFLDLKGVGPADLPVVPSIALQLVVTLKTARHAASPLRIHFQRADEVIA